MRKKKIIAIVLAAGKGTRMKSKTSKQYLLLCDKPVLYYSLKAFEESAVDEIILVAGKEDILYCKENIIDFYKIKKVTKIVAGGTERYLSVLEGLRAIKDGEYVLIHDGARPLINGEIINHCIDGAICYEACVAAMPVKDTIKLIDKDNWVEYTPDRSKLWMMQTPQAFNLSLIKKAYQILEKKIEEGNNFSITDDAMVLETFLQKKVKIVEGSYQNIKITTVEDLILAKALMMNKSEYLIARGDLG